MKSTIEMKNSRIRIHYTPVIQTNLTATNLNRLAALKGEVQEARSNEARDLKHLPYSHHTKQQQSVISTAGEILYALNNVIVSITTAVPDTHKKIEQGGRQL